MPSRWGPSAFRKLLEVQYGAREVIRTEGRDTWRVVGGELDGIVMTSGFIYDLTMNDERAEMSRERFKRDNAPKKKPVLEEVVLKPRKYGKDK